MYEVKTNCRFGRFPPTSNTWRFEWTDGRRATLTNVIIRARSCEEAMQTLQRLFPDAHPRPRNIPRDGTMVVRKMKEAK